jgi:hypothetical protein
VLHHSVLERSRILYENEVGAVVHVISIRYLSNPWKESHSGCQIQIHILFIMAYVQEILVNYCRLNMCMLM